MVLGKMIDDFLFTNATSNVDGGGGEGVNKNRHSSYLIPLQNYDKGK